MWFKSKDLMGGRMGQDLSLCGSSIMAMLQVVLMVMYTSVLQCLLICSGSNSWKELRIEQLVPCSCITPGKPPELKALSFPRYHCQLPACLLKGPIPCLEPENELRSEERTKHT
ncbi:hypothetical protein EI555_004317 [Monodon monoceros]|uniref:Uncharacterized protein n=1 Tax=Monodon monoceros TaxID=40151 RepID=A0A4U1FM92_MONMO|nr:hypothetical protein EI555_004317 [Monodon monoceros]